MPPIAKALLACASLTLLLATALGAYASHGLEGVLAPRALASLETAIEYQFYHGLGLLAVALLADRYPQSRWLKISGALFIAGIVLFCGSLYATTLGEIAALGRVTPVGGIAFMGAWVALAVAALMEKSRG
ncbi:MAG TPA: DUF423 domain-containing protein [Gammaproteobacteria bacterium]